MPEKRRKSRKSSPQLAQDRIDRADDWQHAQWSNKQVDFLCRAYLEEREQRQKLKQELEQLHNQNQLIERLKFKCAQQARWLNDLSTRYKSNQLRRRFHGMPIDAESPR